jgi:hypothetical protein
MMSHRSTVRAAVPTSAATGRLGHERCAAPGEPAHVRSDCERDMDQRIGDAIRRHGLTRGAALALYGEAIETHPEDPCLARQQLEDALGDLVLA